jgi:carboxyl-terminal processing protease
MSLICKRFLKSKIGVVVMLVTLASVASYAAVISNPKTIKLLQLYAEVFSIIKKEYVTVKEDKYLVESSLKGMLGSLDPHSVYLDEKEYKKLEASTNGEFGGIGIEMIIDNALKVISPIDGTPAYKAGIMPGDVILAVDGEAVAIMTPDAAVKKMRGVKGTKVKLTIMRLGEKAPLEFELTRDIIKLQSVKFNLYDDIGYIRISSFSKRTAESVRKAILKLNKKANDQVKGYVLDLRSNPGGRLDAAIYVTELFLDGGEIASTKGRSPRYNEVFTAKPGNMIGDRPMVILINGGSASASEIVAGALQDHRRAVIMGTKSFGKGSVQTLMPIKGYGALKLTTARYYTPSGRSIQADGIVPDIIVEPAKLELLHTGKGKKLFDESSFKGHLKNENSEATIRSKMNAKYKELEEAKKEGWVKLYQRDYQLARALDLLKSVKIFGNK